MQHIVRCLLNVSISTVSFVSKYSFTAVNIINVELAIIFGQNRFFMVMSLLHRIITLPFWGCICQTGPLTFVAVNHDVISQHVLNHDLKKWLYVWLLFCSILSFPWMLSHLYKASRLETTTRIPGTPSRTASFQRLPTLNLGKEWYKFKSGMFFVALDRVCL